MVKIIKLNLVSNVVRTSAKVLRTRQTEEELAVALKASSEAGKVDTWFCSIPSKALKPIWGRLTSEGAPR